MLNLFSLTLWSLLFFMLSEYYFVFALSSTIINNEIPTDILDDHYAIVVDAGSTGSRAFILKFFIDNQTHTKNVTSWKGAKVEPGLSSFSNDSIGLINNIIPIFMDAKQYIPSQYHKTTSIYIKGTAGMRLLPLQIQELIWKILHSGLQSYPNFPFQSDIQNMGTIDGQHEAFYAVISSNYIEGSINAEMVPQEGTTMVGAFDMGGSSTQLIFHKGVHEEGELNDETASGSSSGSLKQHDFWSHSWINYGVEKIRERVWEMLIQNASSSSSSSSSPADDKQEDSVTSVTYVPNPCTFVGHEHVWNEEYVLLGTGDSVSCVKLIEQVLWNIEHNTNATNTSSDTATIMNRLDDDVNSSIDIDDIISNHDGINDEFNNDYGLIDNDNDSSSSSSSDAAAGASSLDSIHDKKVFVDVEVVSVSDGTSGHQKSPKYIDGIVHPPLRGRFYGMSVYFYAMDCIRQLGPVDLSQHWPSPRIDDLEEAAHAFCGMDWKYVQASLHDTHPYTKNSQLANRCIEGLYIVTLLEHAFGLNGQEQNITLALDVKGIEVEWTLGFALAEIVPSLWTHTGHTSHGHTSSKAVGDSSNGNDSCSSSTSSDTSSSSNDLNNDETARDSYDSNNNSNNAATSTDHVSLQSSSSSSSINQSVSRSATTNSIITSLTNLSSYLINGLKGMMKALFALFVL